MSRSGGMTRWRGSTGRVLLALCCSVLAVAVLAGVTAIGVVALRPLTVTGASSRPAPRVTAESVPQVPLLRPLPVVRPGSGLQAVLDKGLDPRDQEAVKRAVAGLAAAAGLSAIVPALWEHPRGRFPADWSRHYPYDYPGVTEWLSPYLTPAVLDHGPELVDLAGLLTIDAAWQRFVSGVDYTAAAAAFVILDRLVAAHPGDCDAAVDLAGQVSMGQRPRAWVVDRLFRAAVSACPGDPTPRWWWVHQQALWSAPALGLAPLGLSSEQALARPLRTAHRWEHDDPGSPLPWAAEADALLAQAAVMRRTRVMPFTVRANARRALELMRRADSIEHDAAFVAGQARALDLLERPTDAADTMAPVVEEAPRNGAYRDLDVTLLAGAHRWHDAVVEDNHTRVDLGAVGELVPDGTDPVVLGAGNAFAVTITDPTSVDLGAGGVVWEGYLPDYRDTQTLPGDLSAWCYGLSYLRLAVVGGSPQQGAGIRFAGARGCNRGLTPDLDLDRPAGHLPEFRELHAVAAQLLGRRSSRDRWLARGGVSLSTFFDDAQNLFRWAGELDRAREMTSAWAAELPDDPAAHQRAAEIAYLAGDDAMAESELRRCLAAPIAHGDAAFEHWGSAERAQAELDLGTVLEDARDRGSAMAAYRDAVRQRDAPPTVFYEKHELYWWSVTSAWARIGYAELAEGRAAPAVVALRKADRRVANAEIRGAGRRLDPVQDARTSGAEANNLAVALLELGSSPTDAVAAARRAVTHDPASPVYADTLGQALQTAGEPVEAAHSYRVALREDPTLFQSWNNLGVLRSEAGDHGGALAAFRAALRSHPDYATAWFNLGGELGRGRWHSLRDFVASQRALARAVRLDPGLRGQSAGRVIDTGAEITGLDVSRPVPVDWTYGSVAKDPTPGFAWVALLLALWRLALSLGLDKAGSWAGERTLGAVRAVRRPWDLMVPLPLALLACVAVGAWPVARAAGGQWWQLAVTVAAIAALAWLYAAVTSARRRGWVPGMVFGALSAVVGYAFVPMPVDGSVVGRRARWAGCALLGASTGLFLGLAWLAGTPLLRIVGLAAFVMLSTALFPLKPYDGGFLRARLPSVVLSLVLLVVSSAVVLGWV